MRFWGSLLLVAAMLSGCASDPHFQGTDPSLTVYSGNELPTPSEGAPGLIGPYDKLSVNVFGAPELSLEEIQVDSSGRIAMPLIGTVEAGGKSTQDIGREIEQRLGGRYVREPRVAVNLRESLGHLVTVGGEVREPGVFPVSPNMTLLGAIARAKGRTEFSRLEDVVVFRTVNGQRLVALYNLAAIEQGNYRDPEIYANDVVMVGDSPARRRYKDILQAAPAIIGPLIYVLAR